MSSLRGHAISDVHLLKNVTTHRGYEETTWGLQELRLVSLCFLSDAGRDPLRVKKTLRKESLEVVFSFSVAHI